MKRMYLLLIQHEDSRSEDEDEDIITNSVYVIIDVQEADGYKLVYLINYWNRGKWNKQFGQEDEAWETNKALKAKLDYEAVLDATFWMTFDDWMSHFNTLYYCRLFSNSWSQYCLTGEWIDTTSGGAPPKVGIPLWDQSKAIVEKKAAISPMKTRMSSQGTKVFSFTPAVLKKTSAMPSDSFLPSATLGSHMGGTIEDSIVRKQTVLLQSTTSFKQAPVLVSNQTLNISPPKEVKIVKEPENLKIKKELERRVIMADSDDRWFLNPQYKVHLKPGNKLIISLMQENEKISRKNYERVNFVIMLTRGKYSRVWEYKEDDIIKKGLDTDLRYYFLIQ